MLVRLAWALGVVFAGCAVAQTVIAVAGIETNQDWASPIALLAVLVALVPCLSARAGLAPCLIAPAAAAEVIAEQYTIDPYYFPAAQRYAENAAMTYIFVLAALLLLTVPLTLRHRRVGAVLVGVLLPVLFVTSLGSGLH